MIENLRKNLKEDIWKLINNEEIKEYDLNEFILFSFYLLLECKQFKFDDVLKLSEKLKTSYYKILNNTNNLIEENFGEILEVFKDVDEKFVDEVKPIIKKIKGLNNG